jgi:hypothetical protein
LPEFHDGRGESSPANVVPGDKKLAMFAASASNAPLQMLSVNAVAS